MLLLLLVILPNSDVTMFPSLLNHPKCSYVPGNLVVLLLFMMARTGASSGTMHCQSSRSVFEFRRYPCLWDVALGSCYLANHPRCDHHRD